MRQKMSWAKVNQNYFYAIICFMEGWSFSQYVDFIFSGDLQFWS